MMRIYRSVAELPANFGPSAVTIGNFDGVHTGHRRIVRRLVELARANGWKPSLLTFDPHPTRIVAPTRTPLLMTTPEERCELMERDGVEQALILPFTDEVAHWSPEEFARRILREAMDARAVLVGNNFRFGYRQAGDSRLLTELGERLGFITELLTGVFQHRTMVSSSMIRQLVEAGAMNRVRHMLERPFCLEGRVVAGHGVGARQTVPTLNLEPDSQVMPKLGVYVTRATDLESGRQWPSVSNIGYRPTFNGHDLSIETFLLEDPGAEPPSRIRVEFLHRLRDERKFPNPEALKAQILRDVARAHAYFRRRAKWHN